MTAIRLFATTSNANAPHSEPFPGAMGGQHDVLELDVTLARMLRANVLVVGPWHHGGWASTAGEKLGPAAFGSKTAEFYRAEVEFPFFEKYLSTSAYSLASSQPSMRA